MGIWMWLAGMLVTGPAFAEGDAPPLKAVPYVDLNRYVGTWYELARYPNRFQRNCVRGTTAQYAFDDDGDISVLNRCVGKKGETIEAKGYAKVVDKQSQAILKVVFFWPFSAPYWVIDLGPEYEYAVVGQPSREYLWVLSRTPSLSAETWEGIRERLVAQGYDPNRLEMTAP